MVDISPEGVSFERDDLCNTMNGEFLKNKRLLDSAMNKAKGAVLGTAKGALGELLGLGPGGLSDPSDAINGALGGAGDATGGVQGIKDKVLNKKLVEGSNVDMQAIADCLGGGFPGLGFPSMGSPIDLSDLAKLVENLLGAILDKLFDLIKEALSPLEELISDALSALKDLLPLDLLDEILNLIQCLEGCPNVDQSKLPTIVDIENQISAVGLKITGAIDWESESFSGLGEITDDVKEQFDNIMEAKETVVGSVDVVKGVEIPKAPTPPKIPRASNPLDGLSIKDKLESLF